MCAPEIGPILYAAAIKAKPKAIAIPNKPIASLPIAAAPAPIKTRIKVPINSAMYFFVTLSP